MNGAPAHARARAGARARARRRIPHERKIFLLAMVSGLPAAIVSLVILWTGNYTPKVQWTLTVLIGGFWLGFAWAVRENVIFPLRTLSNLLAALREGDFSVRARAASAEEALGEVMIEVNALSGTLRQQRFGALEATALLRKVMAEIDVAVFTFDGEQHLRLVNRAGERLLGQPAERLLGRTAAELRLDECLAGEEARTIQVNFPGGVGRWGMRRSDFRESGLPHHLLVLTDLSRALREEERQAWQRLIRVLGHEMNNSLTPIKSLASSLESLLMRDPPPSDFREDMRSGLTVIASRVEALSRFMKGYSQLARLPQPQFAPVPVGTWVRRVVSLETRLPVTLEAGPDMVIRADGDQLEQLLINLIRNATDASMETGGGVAVGWRKTPSFMELWVRDEGPGLANTSNLFVPFFTTKPGGSGIGLVLSRQIAEAHGGSLTLENRSPGPGCEARLRLPLNF